MNNALGQGDETKWDAAASRQLDQVKPARAKDNQDKEAAKTRHDRRLDFQAWQREAKS